jgi:hypothetical protein
MSIIEFAMLTVRSGEYMPFLLVSRHGDGYAHHFEETADGNDPSGTFEAKSSAKIIVQPGMLPVGMACPDVLAPAGGGGGGGAVGAGVTIGVGGGGEAVGATVGETVGVADAMTVGEPVSRGVSSGRGVGLSLARGGMEADAADGEVVDPGIGAVAPSSRSTIVIEATART